MVDNATESAQTTLFESSSESSSVASSVIFSSPSTQRSLASLKTLTTPSYISSVSTIVSGALDVITTDSRTSPTASLGRGVIIYIMLQVHVLNYISIIIITQVITEMRTLIGPGLCHILL